MTRPQKEPELLQERIIFRCGKELYDKIHDAALAAGLTQSDVMRRKLSRIKIQDKTQLEMLGQLATLRQLCIRQVQLLKQVNIDPENDTEKTSCIETQKALIKKIERIMDSFEEQFLERTQTGDWRQRDQHYL